MSTTQPEFTMSQYASKDDMIGAMRQHIAELESRVQELGQMARDANSRRVIELDEVREQIDAVLSAFELRYTTHPITGEPMGTDAQEATAWRLKAENLERENAVLLMANATTASKEASMALSDDRIAEMMRDTWGCSSIAPRHAAPFARAIEAEVRKQEREACALLAEQAHPHDWPFIGAAIRGRARLEDAK